MLYSDIITEFAKTVSRPGLVHVAPWSKTK